MPTKNEPRVTIRLSAADHAVLTAAAESADVAVGALIREAAVRYAAQLAREAGRGEVRMRRAPGVRARAAERKTAESARDLLGERQRRLNEMRGRP